MPRPMTFFRFDNSSKESGLSFRCCGKPEDLLDEPQDFFDENRSIGCNDGPSDVETRMSGRKLDSFLVATLCNEHRLMKERMSNEALVLKTSPPSPGGWSLEPFHFRTTASTPNLRKKPLAPRSKIWIKRRIVSHSCAREAAYGNVIGEYSTLCDSLPPTAHDEKREAHPNLRSVRSMPFLNEATLVSTTIPTNRHRRPKCSSQLSISALDWTTDTRRHEAGSANVGSSSPRQGLLPTLGGCTRDSCFTMQTGSAKTSSSKYNTTIFSKCPKISTILSLPRWSHIFVHRQPKVDQADRKSVV